MSLSIVGISKINFSFFYKNEPELDEALLKEKEEIKKQEKLELFKKVEFIKVSTVIIAVAAVTQIFNLFN